MFQDMWTISGKYDGRRGLEESPGSFDATEAAARAICPDDPEGFLDTGFHRLYDCFLLPDMNDAVDRILEAADTSEKIGIFGDYDCDGVCATALLYDFLKKGLGCEVIWRVPERREGYGLSKNAVDEFSEKGVTLIITVDNGISAVEEIDYCNTLGIDVIVTDHHEITMELPRSIANCDPERPDSRYPFSSICGCAVAYKLCEAVSASVGIDGIENYLPLAAIATVADMMELTDENRSIVKLGLEQACDTMFPGLNLLVAERLAAKRAKKVTSDFVAFYLAPVINAAGRMGMAEEAVKLLVAESEKEAAPILDTVLKLKDTGSEKIAKMRSDFEADPKKFVINDPSSGFVFVKGEGWDEGLIGNFAGSLCEKMNKCICVLTEDRPDESGEMIYKASVRGISALESFKALSSCRDLMIRFGGHANASGFNVLESNLQALCDRVDEYCRPAYKALPSVNSKEALIYLPPEFITLETAENQSALEPFGLGNPQPVYVTGGIVNMNVNKGPSGNVIRFRFFFRGGSVASGVNFRDMYNYGMISSSVPAAVVYTLSVNEYNGERKPQLNVLDIIEGEQTPQSGAASDYASEAEKLKNDLFRSFHVTREELFIVYKALKDIGGEFTFKDVANLKLGAMKAGGKYAALFTWFKLKYSIEVFTELGLLEKDKAGSYRVTEVREKKELADSPTFDAIGTVYD